MHKQTDYLRYSGRAEFTLSLVQTLLRACLTNNYTATAERVAALRHAGPALGKRLGMEHLTVRTGWTGNA